MKDRFRFGRYFGRQLYFFFFFWGGGGGGGAGGGGGGVVVGFVALRPKSTAMVIAGRSVHPTTLFPGQV